MREITYFVFSFQRISVPLNWKNESFSEEVAWFQNESDTSMNSNAYDVASKLVQQYFPTDFGSETLVKQIVDVILEKVWKIANSVFKFIYTDILVLQINLCM